MQACCSPAASSNILAVRMPTGGLRPLLRSGGSIPQALLADASDALVRGVVLEGPIQHPAWHAAYESLTLPRLDRLTLLFGP